MILTSDQIRERIKEEFDSGKYFWEEKLHKTNAIKDKAFFVPDAEEFKKDFETVKEIVAQEYKIDIHRVHELLTHESIYDCDNMARKLRTSLHDLHYKRYRAKWHSISHEYACFQVTEIRPAMLINQLIAHDFCMIFTAQGIYFGDLSVSERQVWSLKTFRPHIIGIF
ncbi:MAG: hypothetical protein WDA09_08185 [Bacteriovoracaceae bacterium]